MTKKSISLDIGGTSTRIAVVDETGEILERHQFSTITTNPLENLEKIDEIINQFNHDPIGIGISCPGPLDLKKGIILTPPNLPGWHGFEIVKEAENLFQLPVLLENDANLAAYAEAIKGKGKDADIVQYLTISTGIGSGLIVNGEIYQGTHGFAGEIANSILWKDGPQVGDLKKGSIESIASGTGIVNQARLCGLDVNHAGEVYQLANLDNENAKKIMNQSKDYIANMIAIIIAVIDPGIIILGGGLALKIPQFVEEIELLVKEKVYQIQKENVRITRSNLGDDNGLIGGGLYVFKQFGDNSKWQL